MLPIASTLFRRVRPVGTGDATREASRAGDSPCTRHRVDRTCLLQMKRRRSSAGSYTRVGFFASTSMRAPLLVAARRPSPARFFRFGKIPVALPEDPTPSLEGGVGGRYSSGCESRNMQLGNRKILSLLLLVSCPCAFIKTRSISIAIKKMLLLKKNYLGMKRGEGPPPFSSRHHAVNS